MMNKNLLPKNFSNVSTSDYKNNFKVNIAHKDNEAKFNLCNDRQSLEKFEMKFKSQDMSKSNKVLRQELNTYIPFCNVGKVHYIGPPM